VYNFFTGCSRTNYCLSCDTKFTLNYRHIWSYDMSFCVIIRPKFQTVFFETDTVVGISYRSRITWPLNFWFTSVQLFFLLLLCASTVVLGYTQLYALRNHSVCFSIVIILWTNARCISEIKVLWFMSVNVITSPTLLGFLEILRNYRCQSVPCFHGSERFIDISTKFLQLSSLQVLGAS
jgi:hypothetical protein